MSHKAKKKERVAGKEERCWWRKWDRVELEWKRLGMGRKGRLGRNIKWENEMFKLAG